MIGARRIVRAVALAVAAGLLAAMTAGCASGGSSAVDANATGTTGTTGTTGATGATGATTAASLAARQQAPGAVSCVVGDWRSTHVEDTLPGQFTEAGGAGVTMRIAANGATVIDFNSMAPMHITAKTYTADFSFRGRVAGRLILPKSVPTGSAFSLQAAAGSALDDDSLTVTVQVTSPMSATLGPLSISAMAKEMGSQSSSMPDAPGTEGSWTCSGNTLINRGPASLPTYGSWTWTRTS